MTSPPGDGGIVLAELLSLPAGSYYLVVGTETASFGTSEGAFSFEVALF